MKRIVVVVLALVALMNAHQIEEVVNMKDLQVNPASIAQYNLEYLNLKVSNYDFNTTLNRAKKAIKQQKLKLFAILDHAQAAKEFDKSLPPTSVIVFGNPGIGTAKMLEFPNLAIELPLKVLIYERDGKVFVGYVRPSSFATALGLPANDVFVINTQEAYEKFTNYLVH